MSKRHYVMQPDRSYRCVSCRQEFSTRQELGKHYGLRGTCRKPIALGMNLDPNNLPYRWTSKKPENTAVSHSKAA